MPAQAPAATFAPPLRALAFDVFGTVVDWHGGIAAEAAALAGVPVDRTRLWAHVLVGALTGLAGVVNCSRLGSADPNAGVGFELSVIAAVVVGGTSLSGGQKQRVSVARASLNWRTSASASVGANPSATRLEPATVAPVIFRNSRRVTSTMTPPAATGKSAAEPV